MSSICMMRPPVHDAFPQDIQTDPDAHGNAVAIIPGRNKKGQESTQRSGRTPNAGPPLGPTAVAFRANGSQSPRSSTLCAMSLNVLTGLIRNCRSGRKHR
jgi:hypothetical protein